MPVEMDPEALQRCLVNLVDNALDACRIRPGTRVLLRTLPYQTGGVEYQVVDSGCGMDEATRTRLFQSFFSTKGTEGTGIGLMMAKRIVDQHAGHDRGAQPPRHGNDRGGAAARRAATA